MKSVKKIVLFLTISMLSLGAFAQAKSDIVTIAAGSAEHTTLVAAVKAAGLVETLKSKGPFTVFAPVNAAFNKLPDGTVESLLKPENKAQLTGILTYHVVAGNLDAKAVLAAIQKGGGKAIVTTTDLKATNGVIHVIDTVVLPAAE